MKKLPLVFAVVCLSTLLGRADDQKADKEKKKAQPEKPAITLKVGDPAPVLKTGEWLQGAPVTHFEPGKVYVVEFWATWCGPCIAMMPHTADLQAEYKNQGVTMISYTGKDPHNSREQVVEFVKKRGPKLPLTFAYNDEARTWDGWMKDAGRNGIPCAFVVDKTGRIAYIGHPMFLGAVLPKAIAGEPPQAISEEAAKVQKEWTAAVRTPNGDDVEKFKASLAALKDFEAKYPAMANISPSINSKLRCLARIGDVPETKKVAEAAITKALARDDQSLLRMIATILREGPAKDNKELVAMAVKASEANVHIAGDNDARALIELTKTYWAAGEKGMAAAAAHKAAVNVGDKEVSTLTNLANVYATIGNKPEAKKFAEKAGKAIDDKSWSPLLELAKTYAAIGEKAEADQYARKALAAIPEGSPSVKRYVEAQVQKLDGEKQEEKK